jgi:MFS family permease
MTPSASVPPPQRLTLTHWLILIMAAIGFAFDIYELLMLPLILRPALMELLGAAPGTETFNTWFSILFYVPALAGGVFGLLGGYLTDWFGRRRVLTASILLYACSAFLAGFSTNIWMLLFLRSTTFIGFCVEFVAAVAWLAELFPNPHQRERVLGYTQAFSSLGGLLVAIANGIMLDIHSHLPAIQIPDFLSFLGDVKNPHDAWRYTLMSGLIPAIPLILIRPFLPESHAWLAKKQSGTLKRPSILQLFSPELRKTTIITTLMVACNYGAALGAIQLIPRIVPGLPDVKVQTSVLAKPDARLLEQKTGSEYTKVQEVGGLVGRFLLAMLAVAIVSRRWLLRLFQLPGLLFVPLVFWFFLDPRVDNQTYFVLDLSAIYLGKFPFTTVSIAVLFVGLLTVAQFSFWGNYLPRVYPLHLRGTGEGFAANIGGRAIGTGFNAVTVYLSGLAFVPGNTDPEKITAAAAIVALFVYAVGSLLCFWLPEPKGEMSE